MTMSANANRSTRFTRLWLAGLVAMTAYAATSCGNVPLDDFTETAEEALSGTNLIKVVNDGLCLDVSGASKLDGAPVIQWTCSGRANQQWTLKSAGTGIYNLVSVNSGKCMDVYTGSTLRGAAVDQWTCNGHTSQQWQAVSKGSGQYELHAVVSGLCLDVTGASTLTGTKLEQWTCNGGSNQRFTFSPVASGTDGGTGGSSGADGSSGTGGSSGAGGSGGTGSGGAPTGTVLWDGDAAKGTSVFKILNLEGSATATVVDDPKCGKAFEFDKPADSKRSEGHAARGFEAKEGDLIYIGWLSKVTMPTDLTTNAVFQWKAYGTNIQQNFPFIIKTMRGMFALEQYNPGMVMTRIWTTPLVTDSWHSFVVAIKVSADIQAGYLELWFDGKQQTFSTGKTRFSCRTLDADYCDPKWGVYGGQGTDASNRVCALKIGSSYDAARPPSVP
jgi:uncharacterized membrane protein YgcG